MFTTKQHDAVGMQRGLSSPVQRPVENQGRGRFLPVDDIIFSRQNLSENIFLQCKHGKWSYMVLSESDIIFLNENWSDIFF